MFTGQKPTLYSWAPLRSCLEILTRVPRQYGSLTTVFTLNNQPLPRPTTLSCIRPRSSRWYGHPTGLSFSNVSLSPFSRVYITSEPYALPVCVWPISVPHFQRDSNVLIDSIPLWWHSTLINLFWIIDFNWCTSEILSQLWTFPINAAITSMTNDTEPLRKETAVLLHHLFPLECMSSSQSRPSWSSHHSDCHFNVE